MFTKIQLTSMNVSKKNKHLNKKSLVPFFIGIHIISGATGIDGGLTSVGTSWCRRSRDISLHYKYRPL